MTTRSLLVSAALLLAALQPARASGAPDDGSLELRPGDRGVALTAVEGDRIAEIPLTYVGLQKNFIGPGYDLHLVQLEGPIADRVGVAAGMSGSPVYFEGKLVGALSYRLGVLPREPIAGVTPIEDMLRADRGGSTAKPRAAALGAAIGTPIHIGGLSGRVRDWAAPQLEQLGFVLVAGGGVDSNADQPAPLRPGSPVGVELVRGDLAIAATGTVTWVDGDRVFAFGHPFLGSGPIEMPMVSAAVVHTLADMAGSVKLARVGRELGAVLDDRLTAIVGQTGRTARMIPLRLDVRGADYGAQRFEFEVARSSRLSPLLAAVSVANALGSNAGYDSESTMLASGRVRFEGLPELSLEMAAAGRAGSDPVLDIAVMLQQTLAALWLNPFTEVDVRGVELEVDVSSEVHSYEVEALQYDRTPLRAGDQLSVRCVLRQYRGDTTTRTIRFELPDELPQNGKLALVVGAPESVDRVIGRPHSRRLQTAENLRAVIDALGDRRSAHRLTAVLLENAARVVSRGVEYSSLPPSAERLLAGRVRTGERTTSRVSELARAEIELDGPVAGSAVVRLQVDPDLAP